MCKTPTGRQSPPVVTWYTWLLFIRVACIIIVKKCVTTIIEVILFLPRLTLRWRSDRSSKRLETNPKVVLLDKTRKRWPWWWSSAIVPLRRLVSASYTREPLITPPPVVCAIRRVRNDECTQRNARAHYPSTVAGYALSLDSGRKNGKRPIVRDLSVRQTTRVRRGCPANRNVVLLLQRCTRKPISPWA